MDADYRDRTTRRRIGAFVLAMGLLVGACGNSEDRNEPDPATTSPATTSDDTTAVLNFIRNRPPPPSLTENEIQSTHNTSIRKFNLSPQALEAIRKRNQQLLFCTNWEFPALDGEIRQTCLEWDFLPAPPKSPCVSCPEDLATGLPVDQSRFLDGLDLNNPAAVWEDPGVRSRLIFLAESAEERIFAPEQADSLAYFVNEAEKLKPRTPLKSFQLENYHEMGRLAKAMQAAIRAIP